MSNQSSITAYDESSQETPPSPYMLAGAPSNPEVHLASGQVSLNRQLLAIQAGPNINYGIQISYNSSSANQADTWNLDAPSDVTGFAWSFARDQIILLMDSSTMLPRYALALQGNIMKLKRNGVEGEEQLFVTEPYQFWKIRYIPASKARDEKWIITLDNGLVYYFGKTVNSVELGIKRGNYYGNGTTIRQEQIGVVWNLAKIEDQWGNKLEFSYEQVKLKLGTYGDQFTRSCHLTKITSSDGRYTELSYEHKEISEYERPHVPPEGENPGKGTEAYQDRYEEDFLDTVTLYNDQNQVMKKVKLGYKVGLIGDIKTKTTKRTLYQIQRLTTNDDQIEPAETFNYYDRQDKIPNALYGALKNIITPSGAIVSYQYQSQEASNCPLNTNIRRPGEDYDTPSAFYGPNYVVVGWTKKIKKNSYTCKLTVYTWLGYWAAQYVGEVPYSLDFSVLPGSNFFTIVSDNANHTLSLVAQDMRKPAEWTLTPYTDSEVPKNRLVSNGLDFVAAVKPDASSQQLMVFSRIEGTSHWEFEYFDIPPLLQGKVKSQYCLNAQGETIFTAMCPLPKRHDQNNYLKLKMFVRSKAGGWINSGIVTGPEIKLDKGWLGVYPGSKRSAITMFGASFVALQVSLPDNDHHKYWEWQHYAFVWTKTLDEVKWMKLKTVLEIRTTLSLEAYPKCHMRAVEHALHIDLKKNDHSGTKYLYRYLGPGFPSSGGSTLIEKEFDSSGADNQFYYGPDSFTIDHDKKSKLWSLDLYDNQWKQREVTPFKDDAPAKYMSYWNLFCDIWEIASYMFIVLPIPLVGELALLSLELKILAIDLYLSLRSAGPEGFHAGSNYFSAHHEVWHQETNGSYKKIGNLIKDGETLESQYTQAATDYIAYSVKNEGTFVQMLKNGQFLGDRILVEDPEYIGFVTVKERFWLGGVGPHCLLTWSTSKDAQALPRHMNLFRIAGEQFQGKQTAYCVSRVTVDDGFRKLHTDYQYDGASALSQGNKGMQFGTVTTLFSGTADSPSDASGKQVSHYYAWKDGSYHNWILNGSQYAEEIYEPGNNSSPIQQWTQTYQVYKPLQSHPDVFYVRSTNREEIVDDCVRTTCLSYCSDNGMVEKSETKATNVKGKDATFATLYDYAFSQAGEHKEPKKPEQPPEPYEVLKLKNILNAQCQVTQQLTNSKGNTTTVGTTVTTWGQNPSRSDVIVPLQTYQALTPTASFNFSTNSPTDTTQWNQPDTIQDWDSSTGQAIEVATQPAKGVTVTSSTILDTTGELVLATFEDASASDNECGFYGFGGNDQSAGWNLTSTRISRQKSSFQARRAAEAYVVSAYFLFQPNQKSNTYPTLGFGSQSKKISPDSPLPWQWDSNGTARWQYAEFIVTPPLGPNDLPFASFPKGSKTILGFRFGPVDALFTAAKYDSLLRLPLTNMKSNGYSETALLDYQQRPSAVITSDGGVNALMWNTDATPAQEKAKGAKRSFVPSQTMTLTARNGGPYLAVTQIGQQTFTTPQTSAAVQVAIPDHKEVNINFTISFADCSVQCTFDGQRFGGSVTLTDTNNRITGDSPSPQSLTTRPKKFAVWFAPEYLWVWIDDSIIIKAGLTRLEPSPGNSWQLSVSDDNSLTVQNSNAEARLRELCVALDPIANTAYNNGLGQEIQTQALSDDAASMVYYQSFFNGWGEQEIQTKPMSGSLGEWSYLPTCASFDESNGQLSGDVVTYYQPIDETNAPYAYTRVRCEENPLGRPKIVSMPGKDFQTTGKGLTTFSYGTQDQYASSLLSTLGLSSQASSFTAKTSLRYIGTQAVPEVTLMNQRDETVATSLGVDGANQQVEKVLTGFLSGDRSTTITPPGGSAYDITTNNTFWGTPADSDNCDTGTTQYTATYAGQVRFEQKQQKQEGTEEEDTIIIVNKYDRLGRVVEQGELKDKWSNLTQANAENPKFPLEGDEKYNYKVRVRMIYDIDMDMPNTSLNLRGQLWKIVTYASGTGSDKVVQTFSYDVQGRVLTTDLTVSGFDDTARRTSYTYDWMGNVQSITYPGDDEYAISYTYNANGRLAQIVNVSTKTEYASYSYTLDGAIDVVQSNNSAWSKQYGYTFQGQLNSIAVKAAPSRGSWTIWSDTLQYENSTEGFLGGNIAHVELRGSVSEDTYFEYDSQERLLIANYSGAGPWGKLQFTYDLRNNLTTVLNNESQSDSLTATSDGTSNKLSSVVVKKKEGIGNPNPPADNYSYHYTPDGKVVDNCLVQSTQYDAVLQQAISTISNFSQSTVVSFQYNRLDSKRVLKEVTPSHGKAQTRLYLHGNQALPLREIDQGNKKKQIDYIYGIEGLIASRQGKSETFVLSDHLGSIRATIDGGNLNGDLNGTAYYDVFGTLDVDDSTGACLKSRYLYTGQEFDKELGMYNYRLRLYDPTVSAFLSEDPMKEDYSPFAYVAGNPANYIDPTGAKPLLIGGLSKRESAFKRNRLGISDRRIIDYDDFTTGNFGTKRLNDLDGTIIHDSHGWHPGSLGPPQGPESRFYVRNLSRAPTGNEPRTSISRFWKGNKPVYPDSQPTVTRAVTDILEGVDRLQAVRQAAGLPQLTTIRVIFGSCYIRVNDIPDAVLEGLRRPGVRIKLYSPGNREATRFEIISKAQRSRGAYSFWAINDPGRWQRRVLEP